MYTTFSYSTMTQATLALTILLLLLLLSQESLAVFNLSECNTQKQCVQLPSGCTSLQTCNYLFSSIPSTTDPTLLTMELYTNRSSPTITYVAVGFSTDTKMGNDAVTACSLLPDGSSSVRLSKNGGTSNIPITDGQQPPVMIEFAATNDYLYCKFQQRSHVGSTDWTQPDLSLKHNLLLVRGQAQSDGTLSIHSLDPGLDFPVATEEYVLVGTAAQRNAIIPDNSDPQGGPFNLRQSVRTLFVKFHGILMITAWLGLISIAIYSARYMRSAWPSTTILGHKLWFIIHRSANTLAVLCILTAAVFIFVGKDLRWTGPWFGSGAIKAGDIHSVVGVLSTLLAVMQPINALCRCAPQHPNRPTFNLIHRTSGLIAYTLAALAILIAIYSFTTYSSSPTTSLVILILFFIVCVVLGIGSELVAWKREIEDQRIHAIELNTRNKLGTQAPSSGTYYYQAQNLASSKFSMLASVLFVTIVIISITATIVLVILIVMTI